MHRLKSLLCALLLAAAGTQVSVATAQEATRLSVVTSGASYLLQVPVSKIEMLIPSQDLFLLNPGPSNGPRYFNLTDVQRKRMLSGWFEHESGFKGLREFWIDEQASWDRTGLPKPENVVFETLGEWQLVFYRQPVTTPEGFNTHVRAHIVKADTWIDLHISACTEASEAAQRELIRAMLKTIVVREKGRG